MNKTRLVIVDDLEHVRQGLRTLLKVAEDIEIVGEANNGYEAVGMVQVLQPDVVLTDMEMPKMNGLEAATIIKSQNPEMRIVMITILDSDDFRSKAEAAGVDAFIPKATHAETLFDTIRGVAT